MKIILDQEGKKAIDELMHQALLNNGLNALMLVNQVITSVEIKDFAKEESEKKEKE